MKRKTVLLRDLNQAISATLLPAAFLVHHFSRRLRPVLLGVLASLLLSGCGTVSNLFNSEDQPETTASASTQTGGDITLPPTIPRADSDKVVETSPDETISFDEWRKQREASAESE